MLRTWTIGRKIAVGFAAVVALAILTAAAGVYGLRRVVAEQDQLLSLHAQRMHDAEELDAVFERKIAEARGFFFTRDDHFLDLMRDARARYFGVLERLKRLVTTEEGKQRLAEIERLEAEHQAGLDAAFARLKARENPDVVADLMRRQLAPGREQIYQRISEFVKRETRLLEEAKVDAATHAAVAQGLVLAGSLAAAVLAVAVALVLGRAISRQIG